jgi:hypothetical protein
VHTFIDEAGIFNIPDSRKWSVSCVGAFVIPDDDVEFINEDFLKLKKNWGYIEKEIKGSQLDEAEIASLIKLLRKYDVIFEVTAIDMKLQSHRGIIEHRLKQADKMTEHLTDNHYLKLVEQLEGLKENLKSLSNPLYVQALCTFELLYNVLWKTTLYYSQRKPKELSEFFWIIDAKDKKLTPYEKLWTTIVLPLLQSKSFREPLIQIIEADYSYFEKYCRTSAEPPEHLKEFVSDIRPFDYIDIRDIYKRNLDFERSHEILGLQIVDILTTGIRRAMNGNLQIQGWGDIGALMVQNFKYNQTIRLIDLCGRKKPRYKSNPPYWNVVALTDRLGKQIIKEN